MGFTHSSLSKLGLSKYEEEELIENIKQLYLVENLTDIEVSEKLQIPKTVVNYVAIKFNYNKSKEQRKQSYKDAYFRKYGVYHHMHKQDVKEKIKQTNLERYGCENPYQNKELMKRAYQKKLGVDNPFQSEKVKGKIKQTNLKKYGVEHSMQSIEVQEKVKQTNLEKYGNEYGIATKKIQEKVKQTNLARYGVENVFAAAAIKDKIREQNLLRYGVEYPMQNKTIVSKIKKKFKSGNTLYKMHETKKKNNTYGKSKLEDTIYEILCKEFGKENVERQIYLHKHYYDFRINKSLLLEIHGTYWHNKRPFIECEEHIKEYEKMIQQGGQKKAIANKWRYYDVEKLKYCKENNIPYLALYLNKFEEFNIDNIKELII